MLPCCRAGRLCWPDRHPGQHPDWCLCPHQDGASFAPRALRPGQNPDWRLSTPGETVVKPHGGCCLFSLLVVVSPASSCYCLATVQAGSVRLAGTLGACARTQGTVPGAEPGLNPIWGASLCVLPAGTGMSPAGAVVIVVSSSSSSSWSHRRPFIVVAVIAVAVDLSSAPLHTTGAHPGQNPDWQRRVQGRTARETS